MLLAPALAGLLGLNAIQDFERIELTTTPLGGSVHVLSSRAGGNLAACAGPDGVFLVDSEYEQLSAKTLTAMTELCDAPVRFVCNTHWHFDHTGGNQALAEAGAELVAHENARRRLAAGQLITIIDAEVPPAPEKALSSLTFSDAMNFHLNGEKIHAYHPGPAHTDGDLIVVFEKANAIHVGDLVFSGYPFVDVSSGGHVDGVIRALEAVLARSDEGTRIIPGHGSVLDKKGLAEYVGMLLAFREVIAMEIEAGKDLETIVAERPTRELDAKWGRLSFSPAMFTEMVYLSLVKEE